MKIREGRRNENAGCRRKALYQLTEKFVFWISYPYARVVKLLKPGFSLRLMSIVPRVGENTTGLSILV